MLKKNKTLAGILAIFLGTLGVHKFYQGKWKAGIAYFLFFWTGIPTILGILDGAKLLTEVADEVPEETTEPEKIEEVTKTAEPETVKKSDKKPEKKNMRSRLSDIRKNEDENEDQNEDIDEDE